MLDRARFLLRENYSILLIDLQAHGETPGENISFGYRESINAKSAVNYLRNSGQCDKVISLGVSLGGAASLLGSEPLAVDAYILEAVYPSIENAIIDRLKLHGGDIAGLAAPLLIWQIPLRLDTPLNALRPVEAIKHIKAPVLMIVGSADKHTPLTESLQIYDNAPEPKALWTVQGAEHEDFYRFDKAKYEQVVSAFLAKHINP